MTTASDSKATTARPRRMARTLSICATFFPLASTILGGSRILISPLIYFITGLGFVPSPNFRTKISYENSPVTRSFFLQSTLQKQKWICLFCLFFSLFLSSQKKTKKPYPAYCGKRVALIFRNRVYEACKGVS
jgi:hypothetical protein